MKKLQLMVLLTLLALNAIAQVPQKISYQSVIRDGAGNLLSNQAIGVKISVLKGSASGTAVFVETHTTSTNVNGLATLQIGGGTQTSVNGFSSINWSAGPYFIKTETDPSGGTNYTIIGSSELLSVPYALYAVNGVPGPQGPAGIGCNTHYVGELFGGGIIAHVWREAGNVEHALIVSIEDVNDSINWSSPDTSTTVGCMAFSPNNGQANTNTIINFSNYTSSAAALCVAYSGGGYNDWYLPAIWELEKVFWAAFEINNVLENDNNPATVPFSLMGNPYYWSSTEGELPLYAWNQNFCSGHASYLDKTSFYRVRAVRKI